MEILFSSETSPVWKQVDIKLAGFRPRSYVRLTAAMDETQGKTFRSWADFVTDGEGRVDLTADAPRYGTYSGVDPLGMFWSMELVKTPERPADNGDKPLHMRFTAYQDGKSVNRTLERQLAANGVEISRISENSLVAEYYRPAAETLSNIIVFGGSGGGIEGGRSLARFLSGHGFGALALAYFGLPGLDFNLVRIPLEIIENAIEYLKKRPDAAPGKIGVCGISRGGELSLLCGSVLNDIRAVAALTPSPILWESEDIFNKAPSFTYRGRDFPYVECDFSLAYEDMENGLPHAASPVYARAMTKEDECEKAMIEVERINGPVLMVSGDDDLVWPARELCALAENRFKKYGFKHHYRHVTLESAGHSVFSAGILPTNFAYTSGMPTSADGQLTGSQGHKLLLGGKPRENALGQQRTRNELVSFFRDDAGF
ncbi:MAG: acyl-CoA thioesterase/BAAT N-terminal domain-containing protein [Synergistaceae bacterium]|nr:acyl-CoA thioesterase/BAAT N-terminal domain-containing protein [Synergistaceae bacterium]